VARQCASGAPLRRSNRRARGVSPSGGTRQGSRFGGGPVATVSCVSIGRFGGRHPCAAVTWRFCASARDSSFTQSREFLGSLRRTGRFDRSGGLRVVVDGVAAARCGFRPATTANWVSSVLHTSRFGTMFLATLRWRGITRGHSTSNRFPLCRFTWLRAVASAAGRGRDAPPLRRWGGSVEPKLEASVCSVDVRCFGARLTTMEISLQAGFRRDCGTHRATLRRREERARQFLGLAGPNRLRLGRG